MNTNRTFNFSLLLARVVLGTVIAAHGAQKLLGWFGGFGFDGTMGFFTEAIGLPPIVALLIILAESIGMVALVFGLFSRILSSAVILIMAGAIATTHGAFGFFLNWSGTQGGEGYEFHLLVIALASVISLNGAGLYSIDAAIKSRLQKVRRFPSALFA